MTELAALQKLRMAAMHINHLDYMCPPSEELESEGMGMVCWTDVREVLFPSCCGSECEIVLDALKEVFNYPKSENKMRPCTPREHVAFMRRYRLVTAGTLLVDVHALGENIKFLWDVVCVKHKQSTSEKSTICKYNSSQIIATKCGQGDGIISCDIEDGAQIIRNDDSNTTPKRANEVSVKNETHTLKPVTGIQYVSGDRNNNHEHLEDIEAGTTIVTAKYTEENASTEIVRIPHLKQLFRNSSKYTPISFAALLLPEYQQYFWALANEYVVGRTKDEKIKIRPCTPTEGRYLTSWFITNLGWDDPRWQHVTSKNLLMDIDLILHRHPGGDTKLVGIGNHDYEDGLPDEELDSSQDLLPLNVKSFTCPPILDERRQKEAKECINLENDQGIILTDMTNHPKIKNEQEKTAQLNSNNNAKRQDVKSEVKPLLLQINTETDITSKDKSIQKPSTTKRITKKMRTATTSSQNVNENAFSVKRNCPQNANMSYWHDRSLTNSKLTGIYPSLANGDSFTKTTNGNVRFNSLSNSRIHYSSSSLKDIDIPRLSINDPTFSLLKTNDIRETKPGTTVHVHPKKAMVMKFAEQPNVIYKQQSPQYTGNGDTYNHLDKPNPCYPNAHVTFPNVIANSRCSNATHIGDTVSKMWTGFDDALPASTKKEPLHVKGQSRHTNISLTNRSKEVWYRKQSFPSDNSDHTFIEETGSSDPFTRTINSLKTLKEMEKDHLITIHKGNNSKRSTRRSLSSVVLPPIVPVDQPIAIEPTPDIALHVYSPSEEKLTFASLLKSRINKSKKETAFSIDRVNAEIYSANTNNNSNIDVSKSAIPRRKISQNNGDTCSAQRKSDVKVPNCLIQPYESASEIRMEKNKFRSVSGSASAPTLSGKCYKVNIKDLKLKFTKVNDLAQNSANKNSQHESKVNMNMNKKDVSIKSKTTTDKTYMSKAANISKKSQTNTITSKKISTNCKDRQINTDENIGPYSGRYAPHHKKRWLQQYCELDKDIETTRRREDTPIPAPALQHFEEMYLDSLIHPCTSMPCLELDNFETRTFDGCDYYDDPVDFDTVEETVHTSTETVHTSTDDFIKQEILPSDDYLFNGSAFVLPDANDTTLKGSNETVTIVRRSIRNRGTPKMNYNEGDKSRDSLKNAKPKNHPTNPKKTKPKKCNVKQNKKGKLKIKQEPCDHFNEGLVVDAPRPEETVINNEDNSDELYINTVGQWDTRIIEEYEHDKVESIYHLDEYGKIQTVKDNGQFDTYDEIEIEVYSDGYQSSEVSSFVGSSTSIDQNTKPVLSSQNGHPGVAVPTDTNEDPNGSQQRCSEVSLDGKAVGGFIGIENIDIPYVLMNSFKFVMMADVNQIFSQCNKRCKITKSVIKNYSGLLRSFCNWEQVYAMDVICSHRRPAICTGDSLVRYDSLVQNLDGIKQEVCQKHMTSTSEASQLCEY